MNDRVVGDVADLLVAWHGCWILFPLLEGIRQKALKLDIADRADALNALADALTGLTVTDLSQIPARIGRLLGL